jgi:hypothetical protein
VLSHTAARAFFSGGEASLPTLAGAMTGADPAPRGLLAGAGALDESALARVVVQVCANGRQAECPTWHAYYELRFPDSALRQRVWLETRAVVAQGPGAARTLVERVGALLRGETPEFPNTKRVEAARLATVLYARHFVHAIPFPRAGLRRAWSRCEQGPTALACLDARRAAEPMLTSLEGAPRVR